jgi:hypothetical protein
MTTTVAARDPILVSDRCDLCGAGAKVRATMANGQLYFCGHHARSAGETLVIQALEIYDPERVYDYGNWRTKA